MNLFRRKQLEITKTKVLALKNKINRIEIKSNKVEIETNKVNNIKIKLNNEISNREDIILKQTEKISKINKKEDIKQEILKLIETENKTNKELKQEIVDIKHICSKASYYRYITEMKKNKEIDSLNINNQEFLYCKK